MREDRTALIGPRRMFLSLVLLKEMCASVAMGIKHTVVDVSAH